MHTTLLPINAYLHDPAQNGSVLQNASREPHHAANANRTFVHVARSHVFGLDKSFDRWRSVGNGTKRPRVDAEPWVTRGILEILNCTTVIDKLPGSGIVIYNLPGPHNHAALHLHQRCHKENNARRKTKRHHRRTRSLSCDGGEPNWHWHGSSKRRRCVRKRGRRIPRATRGLFCNRENSIHWKRRSGTVQPDHRE